MCQFAVISVAEPDRHIQTFETGADAGKQATYLNAMARDINSPQRYRVIQVSGTTISQDWKYRERNRITNGTYKTTPWNAEHWYNADHFAHVSKDDPAQIAYTPNPEYGAADRQIRTRPGRYLSQHYSGILSQDQIREWCAKYTKENEETKLKFASDPDTIQWVYENGPHSCMAYEASRYESSCHPTRVYGAGDLAIAYVLRDSEHVSTRALCWPSKKIYRRAYGDENLLEELLEDAGFNQSDDSSEWNGARLLRIEYDGDRFIAPYLDAPNETIEDNGTFLVIDNDGDIRCREINGLSESEGRYRCNNCDERCSETFTVNGQDWCESCYDSDAWRCYSCDEYFSGSSYICDHRGNGICESCASEHQACARCGDYFPEDDVTYSEITHDHYCGHCIRRYMERTHCGEIAESVDDCDCSERQKAREREAIENFELESGESDDDDPRQDHGHCVFLKPTSPRIDDPRQMYLGMPFEIHPDSNWRNQPQIGLTLNAIAQLNNAE